MVEFFGLIHYYLIKIVKFNNAIEGGDNKSHPIYRLILYKDKGALTSNVVQFRNKLFSVALKFILCVFIAIMTGYFFEN